jgi:hypothetical protein
MTALICVALNNADWFKFSVIGLLDEKILAELFSQYKKVVTPYISLYCNVIVLYVLLSITKLGDIFIVSAALIVIGDVTCTVPAPDNGVPISSVTKTVPNEYTKFGLTMFRISPIAVGDVLLGKILLPTVFKLLLLAPNENGACK